MYCPPDCLGPEGGSSGRANGNRSRGFCEGLVQGRDLESSGHPRAPRSGPATSISSGPRVITTPRPPITRSRPSPTTVTGRIRPPSPLPVPAEAQGRPGFTVAGDGARLRRRPSPSRVGRPWSRPPPRDRGGIPSSTTPLSRITRRRGWDPGGAHSSVMNTLNSHSKNIDLDERFSHSSSDPPPPPASPPRWTYVRFLSLSPFPESPGPSGPTRGVSGVTGRRDTKGSQPSKDVRTVRDPDAYKMTYSV